MSEELIQESPAVAEAPAPATETTPETTPAPEPVDEATPEGDGPISEEQFAEAEETVDEPEDKPKKSRFQERIDKLTADKYNAEREARALRERIERLEQRERPEVDPEDYDSIERARLRDVLDEERQYEVRSEAERAVHQAQQVRTELFHAKVEAARDRIPDLDNSLRSFAQLPVTPESAEIIADSPKAAEIAHYLGVHPEIAHDIAAMSPVNQGRALAQIESRVTLTAKKASTAPPPPSKLKPAAAPHNKEPSEMTAAEYVAYRKKQWGENP